MEVKPKRWQNLFFKRCPNCDLQLLDSGLFWKCPANTLDVNCFFINKKKAAEFLLDPEHPANRCLTFEQKRIVNGVAQKEVSMVDVEMAINNLNLIS